MYHTFIHILSHLLHSWLQSQELCLLGSCLKMQEMKIRHWAGPIAMWFNSMAMSWCDKPCKSLKKCKELKKILQVVVRGSCFLLWACLCPGLGVKFHIHLLLFFCDYVASCWVKYCSLCWLFFVASSQGKAQGLGERMEAGFVLFYFCQVLSSGSVIISDNLNFLLFFY